MKRKHKTYRDVHERQTKNQKRDDLPSSLNDWTNEHVILWAREILGEKHIPEWNIEETVKIFERNGVVGDTLQKLTKEELIQAGIGMGPATALFGAIQKLTEKTYDEVFDEFDSEESSLWKDFGLPNEKEQPLLERKVLVDRVINGLRDNSLFVVRGPPQSGKTSLLKLVKLRLGDEKCLTLLPKFSDEDEAKAFLSNELKEAVNQTKCPYILLDEAQRLYPETEFGSVFKTFWMNTARVIQDRSSNGIRVKLLCFAVYGGQFTASSPINLNWRGTTSSEMMISNEETRQYLEQFEARYGISFSKEDVNILFQYTGGHIGYLSAICNSIREKGHIGDITRFLFDKECFQLISNQRASRIVQLLEEEQAAYLMELIRSGDVIDSATTERKDLEKYGLISFENGVGTFSSRILEWLATEHIFSVSEPVRRPERDFGKFLMQTFNHFSFIGDVQPSRSKMVYERDMRNAFWRSCYLFLAKDVHVQPELQHENGIIDIWVNGWGIELLRKGNTLREHWERFRRPGGKYGRINWKEAAVIEIYQGQDQDSVWPKFKVIEGVIYVRVYFNKDFSQVKVCFEDSDRKNKEFCPIVSYSTQRDVVVARRKILNPLVNDELFNDWQQRIDEDWMKRVFPEDDANDIGRWIKLLHGCRIRNVEDLSALWMEKTYNRLSDKIHDSVLIHLRQRIPRS